MNETIAGYLVIGATAAPGGDELPQYLDPVCLASDQGETLFVANVEPWDGSPSAFQPVPRQTFDEECDAGYWQRLEQRFAFDWGWHLVALDAAKPPFYLPAQDAARIVQGRGEDALEAVAADLELGRGGGESDERIWYAARALPRDPFPLLALLALERERLSPTLLADLESELPEQYRAPSPLHGRAQEQGWHTLLQHIRNDRVGARFMAAAGDRPAESARHSGGSRVNRPKLRHLPSQPWLNPFPDTPGFFANIQQQFGRAQPGSIRSHG
ncbi:hypothetical protein [uncultured Lamprocystis sp.]|jgi:hypothetical protein|uniref:hypothetical protein n=1 Tax=uncultured Lamprocystis sp. TaxID=543132 RepID=UPI0025D28879|nr:hypothetical protein [uncultured Lamprocystis sp.]